MRPVSVVLTATLCLTLHTAAAQDARLVLFDFEAGIPGWWGNPWGGGECTVAASTDAKFGSGALLCTYRDVGKGANAVGPNFAPDAPWRAQPWGGLSFWLKGDGSPAKVVIHLETTQEGSTGFSAQRPLESTEWQRIDIPFRTFWSREGLRIDSARLTRVFFGCTGTHEIALDQIALEAPGSDAVLDADASVTPGPLNRALAPPGVRLTDDGRIEVREDLSSLDPEGEALFRAALTLPGREPVTSEARLDARQRRSAEASLLLPADVTEDGTATLAVSLSRGEEKLAAWGYAFPVFAPETQLAPPPIAIYPVPKEIRRTQGLLRLGKTVRVCGLGLAGDDVSRTLGMFAREVGAYYGREVAVEEGRAGPDGAQLVAAVAATPADLPKGLLPAGMARRLPDLGEEGYVLRVTPERAVVVAPSARGAYYGLQSLLAAIDDATQSPDEAAAPCCEIVDWPTFPFRGVTMSNPTSRWGYPNDAWIDPEFVNDFVFRTMARAKLNKIVFIIAEGMEFDSHPELRAPRAWSKAELLSLIDACRENYIEPIPLVTVLGHANWFCIPHPELREAGHNENIACVRHPDTNPLIMEVFQEVIDLFEPTTFHLGMDECWWKTLSLPEAERCPRCESDWPDIVADQAITFHDFLAQRNIRAMMWDDMLLAEHNGGAPYHTSRALERIPRDMLIANWSSSLAPDSSKRFHDLGLEVVRSNSLGVPRNDGPYVIGNMQGLWSKLPWLVDTYFKGSAGYSYLSLIPAAEFSWNLDPRLGGRGLDAVLLGERAASVLRRIALHPSPRSTAAQTPLDLSALAPSPGAPAIPPQAGPAAVADAVPPIDLSPLPHGDVTAARTRFSLPSDRGVIALTEPAQEVTLLLNRAAAEVRLLVTCHVAETDAEAFSKQFRRQESVLGVPIGTLTFELADGTTDALPLLYSYNVLPWNRTEAPPYLCGSLGALTSPNGAVRVYVVQWVNPTPDQLVTALHFTRADTEATPALVAATVVEPSK